MLPALAHKFWDNLKIGKAYNDLKANGDPNHIRAIVVLTDGQDTGEPSLNYTLDELIAEVGNVGEERGNAIKLFTIAFGSDADTEVLRRMSDVTGGKQFKGNPATINQVYAEIELFF